VMSVSSLQLAPYPSDPDTGVCMSGNVTQFCQTLSRHPVSPTSDQVLSHLSSPCKVMDVSGSTNATSSNLEQSSSSEETSSKQSDNIGSIITMLISDQTVDLEEYLTDHSMRQEGEVMDRNQMLKADIKEETLSETVPPTPLPSYCQDFDYYNSDFVLNGPQKSRSSSTSEGDEENTRYRYTDHTNTQEYSYCKPGYSPLVDMSNYTARRQTGMVSPILSPGGSRYPNSGGEKKDEKYWERRRKNNLAAKKSRDSRRVRENQLRLRVLCLENANRVLREQMDRKEGELGHLRERLTKYESLEDCQTNFL